MQPNPEIDQLYSEFARIRRNTNGRLPVQYDGEKLRPNQKCPCGSGKKYKKCCRDKLESMARRRGSHTIHAKDIHPDNASKPK